LNLKFQQLEHQNLVLLEREKNDRYLKLF